jgi:hypothetical protein
MGFLDHTTNNVIIDAVLTERGRELLSQNNGSFQIDSFSFGDDEVDYSNIVKYGLAMGKEKIEKNTPIFEAQTNENLALKYNNITLNNNNLRILYIPYLKKYGDTATTAIELDFTNSTNYFKNIQVLSTLSSNSGQTEIDSNLVDSSFSVKMNNLILKRYSDGSEQNDYLDLDENNIASYLIDGTDASNSSYDEAAVTLTGRQLLSFQVGLSFTTSRVSLSTFQKFGSVSNGKYVINTQVEITGRSSGSRIILPIRIIGPNAV